MTVIFGMILKLDKQESMNRFVLLLAMYFNKHTMLCPTIKFFGYIFFSRSFLDYKRRWNFVNMGMK